VVDQPKPSHLGPGPLEYSVTDPVRTDTPVQVPNNTIRPFQNKENHRESVLVTTVARKQHRGNVVQVVHSRQLVESGFNLGRGGHTITPRGSF
jgi:hypothetical protein